MRQHRPSVSQRIQDALQTERDNGNLVQGSSSNRRLRTNIAESLRRHSRRNVVNFGDIEQRLEGWLFYIVKNSTEIYEKL